MQKMSKSGLTYLIGVLLFGLCYYQLRKFLGNDFVFVLVALIYIAALRYLGHVLEKRSKDKSE
jgi:hypothetical protein